MSVSISIPSALRRYADGSKMLAVSANTVGDALAGIERDHAGLYPNICDETGRLRPHLNLFVNGLHVRGHDILEAELEPGDEITILTAVSGG